MPVLMFMFVFFICMAISIPIGSSIGFVSILPGLVDPLFPADLEFTIRAMFAGIDSFPLLAIPMFIISGIIMARGGVSEKLFNVFSYFIGDKTGGLPCAVIVTCLFFGAISGSATATVAAVGSMTIPLLCNLGYDKVFVTALVAVAGGLGVIIPPSIPFIVFGMSTGASIGGLFIAGILPGILIAFCLMFYSWYHCRTQGEDKAKISAAHANIRKNGFFILFKDSFWAFTTPVIILGSIYSGLASPTEAAVLSVFYALIISIFVYKTLRISDIPNIIKEAVEVCAPTLFILAAAVAFSRVLTLMNVPQDLATWIAVTFSNKYVMLAALNICLLFVGMVMDTSPAILIIAPILMPIMKSMGVEPIHFGVIMIVNLAIGFVTPPIGTNLFVASSVSNIEVMAIAKKAVPFIGYFLLALMLITYIEPISMILLKN